MFLNPVLFHVFYLSLHNLSLVFREIGLYVDGLLKDLFYGTFHVFLCERECYLVTFGHAAPPVDVVGVLSDLVSAFVSVTGSGALSVFSTCLLPFFPPPPESTGFL